MVKRYRDYTPMFSIAKEKSRIVKHDGKLGGIAISLYFVSSYSDLNGCEVERLLRYNASTVVALTYLYRFATMGCLIHPIKMEHIRWKWTW